VIELLRETYVEHHAQELRGAREDAFWCALDDFERLLGVKLFDESWVPNDDER
jgi:hypothetical protein